MQLVFDFFAFSEEAYSEVCQTSNMTFFAKS